MEATVTPCPSVDSKLGDEKDEKLPTAHFDIPFSSQILSDVCHFGGVDDQIQEVLECLSELSESLVKLQKVLSTLQRYPTLGASCEYVPASASSSTFGVKSQGIRQIKPGYHIIGGATDAQRARRKRYRQRRKARLAAPFIGPTLPRTVATMKTYSKANKANKLLATKMLPSVKMKKGGAYYPVFGTRVRGSGGYIEDALSFVPRTVGRLLGAGEYADVTTTASVPAVPVPVMHSADEKVTMCRREFMGSVIASSTAGAFQNQVFQINPGLQTFMPWGFAIANCFQEYRLKGMAFSYVPVVSDYTSSSTLGAVTGGVDYNPLNSGCTNRVELAMLSGAQTVKISEKCLILVECDPAKMSKPTKFIRKGDVTATTNKGDYDWGTFQIGTFGCAANQYVGDLYVSYDIELFKPRMAAGNTVDSAYGTLGAVTSGVFSALTWIHNPMSLTVTDTATVYDTINIPAGTYGKFDFTFYWNGTAAVIAYPTITYTNCTLIKRNQSPVAGVNTGRYMEQLCVQITDPSQASSIRYSGGSIPTTADGTVTCTELCSDFVVA